MATTAEGTGGRASAEGVQLAGALEPGREHPAEIGQLDASPGSSAAGVLTRQCSIERVKVLDRPLVVVSLQSCVSSGNGGHVAAQVAIRVSADEVAAWRVRDRRGEQRWGVHSPAVMGERNDAVPSLRSGSSRPSAYRRLPISRERDTSRLPASREPAPASRTSQRGWAETRARTNVKRPATTITMTDLRSRTRAATWLASASRTVRFVMSIRSSAAR